MNGENSGILADTSVWIDFFRPKGDAGDELERLLTANSVWSCGIVLFELTQGVRAEKEKQQIRSLLSGIPYVEMTSSLWQKAAELSSIIKKRGVTVPLSDILIAAIAIEHNLLVFTSDKHFERIPGVRLYKG